MFIAVLACTLNGGHFITVTLFKYNLTSKKNSVKIFFFLTVDT